MIFCEVDNITEVDVLFHGPLRGKIIAIHPTCEYP